MTVALHYSRAENIGLYRGVDPRGIGDNPYKLSKEGGGDEPPIIPLQYHTKIQITFCLIVFLLSVDLLDVLVWSYV